MKKIILACAIGTTSTVLLAQVLVSAEKITEQESKDIKDATAKVTEAESHLESVRQRIYLAHKCKTESWMEWQTACSIDGNFVTKRYHNSFAN